MNALHFPGGSVFGRAFTFAALAVPLWAVLDVIVLRLATGHAPAWSAIGMRAEFPSLVAWIVVAFAAGALLPQKFFRAAVSRPLQPVRAIEPTRIAILGGGFAGMTTALELEKQLGADGSIAITLISDSNALLFTPMLAEVAGSSIEPTHISSPLRTSLRRTTVVRARATEIDLERKSIALHFGPEDGEARAIEYDHLVLALGAVSNFFGRSDIHDVALNFKSLADAIRIRNHVISMFERADRVCEPELRKRLLTFVIAGGGFAGIELAGTINDFARGILGDYPRLTPDDIAVIVVHARERILPELSATLAVYALAKMQERGVRFHLDTRVAGATRDAVTLDPGGEIPAATLVWTAGTTPHPLIATLDIPRDRRGAAVVGADMRVAGHDGLWAVGDCAAIPDLHSGGTFPPTAQHALREAAKLAENLIAARYGRPLSPFSFESLGALCVIGYQTACAELRVPFAKRTWLISGAFAWFLWRGIYISKLPGFDRKVRVLVDWTTELFFPRDTAQTLE